MRASRVVHQVTQYNKVIKYRKRDFSLGFFTFVSSAWPAYLWNIRPDFNKDCSWFDVIKTSKWCNNTSHRHKWGNLLSVSVSVSSWRIYAALAAWGPTARLSLFAFQSTWFSDSISWAFILGRDVAIASTVILNI